MQKQLTLFFILLTVSVESFSQEVRIDVSDVPLSVVLRGLNVEISFDEKALSNYAVTISQTFAAPEDAINFLLRDKPFKMEKIGNVFVIAPSSPHIENMPETVVVVEKRYILTGELYDLSTGEPLPYAHLQTDRGMTATNELGRFTIVQNNSQPMRIQAHYIGFKGLDTVLNVGGHRLALSPAAFALEEVTVSVPPSSMMMQSGKTSGEIRINHQVARYMPGSADNSVFTLLRMLPGVRASGEPSDDLIVWGSNWSESRLIFDGFTIFGMKSFNDQIGSVNPYMTKDIRLRKGGYDASHGNRIGAIAEVTGNEGNFDKPTAKANIGNYTVNAFVSAPIRKTSALSAAYRQTFYNLYDNVGIDGSNERRGQQTTSGIFISPEYDFRDLYLKYAGKTVGDDRYYVSLYGAEDHFKTSVTHQNYTVNADEKNRQYGAAAAYNRLWNNGNISKFILSYSKFSAATDHISGINDNSAVTLDVFRIDNGIQELSLMAEHRFNVGERHQIQVGGKLQQYASSLNGSENRMNNPTAYIIDNVMLGRFSLQAGLRADWIPNDKIYVQPRISLRVTISEELTATASCGSYKQFASRVPYVHSNGHYYIVSYLTDSTLLSSTHFLAGLAYSRNGWLLSVEGYMKQNKNTWYYIDNNIYAFDHTLWGGDVYLKKEWQKQTIFGSYSVVNAQLPKSVCQEIKLGGIASFRAFHFSTTYVYGTGFPYLMLGSRETGFRHGQENGQGQGQGSGQGQGQGGGHGQGQGSSATTAFSTEPYSRLDLSLTCRLQLKHCRLQAGVSLLNVFNTSNIKYNYHISDQENIFNIYSKATPRLPIVFFEIFF